MKRLKLDVPSLEWLTEALKADVKALLDLAAEALDIEVLYNNEFEVTAENTIKATENFIAAGCDGVIVCNFSESSL